MTGPASRIEKDIQSILESGLAAPSADNHHRYSVRLDSSEEKTVIRCFTHSRPANYPWRRRYVDWISYGAMIENMLLQCNHLKIRCDLNLSVDEGDENLEPKQFAELTISSRDQTGDNSTDNFSSTLAEAIPLRVTNRSPYRTETLDRSLQEKLIQAVGSRSPSRCSWMSNPADLKHLGSVAAIAETERLQSNILHQEVFQSIYRDTTGDRPYGISTKAFNLPPPMEHILMLLKKEPMIELARKLALTKLMGRIIGGQPIRSSSAIAILSAPTSDVSCFLDAGRAMERLWLAATLNGLAVQPLISSCLLALPKTEGVSETTKMQLQKYWMSWLPPGEVPIVLLRIGHATQPAWKSPRPPVESLLTHLFRQ